MREVDKQYRRELNDTKQLLKAFPLFGFNMIKIMIAFAFTLTFSLTSLACQDAKLMSNIIEAETNQLLKNAPTFKHAFEDKNIQLNLIEPVLTQGICQAKLTITLPKADLDEANQYLDEQPAKKILLGAQGYAIPEQEKNEVLYFYQNQQHLKPNNDHNTQLKSLYSNIEYTYQLLAQLRIHLDEKSTNSITWPLEQTQQSMKACIATKKLSDDQCQCRVKKLSAVISPRKMELIHFIESQPYSVATGALNAYLQLSKSINESCSQ